ncbi:MAG TPA: serine/threonine-protein kinase [Candidatus Sericytochromatia bacterium]
MSYCVIPGCIAAQNPVSAKFCLSCGSKLWLKERYRPMQPIGRGGFGRTFLAVDEDIPSKPRCVVKQLYIHNPSSGVSKKAAELFHQEAMRLDELGTHSQIPTLLAHFEQNRRLYLIQELIVGQTLTQELQQKGTYNEMQIWVLLQDLLPVLQYIHARKVVHRDIKPANIIRRRDDNKLVLIDFGVAKLLSDTALLQTGTIIGSPEYMPLEQMKGKAFPASDLYSLGVTCIHLLTGESPLDLYDSINDCWVWRDYLPAGQQVSERLGKILDKLVQNSIKQRYQSADEALQAFNSTQPATTSPLQQTVVQGLVSEVSVDYTKLEGLLRRRKWQEADQLTWDVLCQASGKRLGYYLKSSDIENLPCKDLAAIDQLWMKYSDRRFGFSVQKSIYEDVGEDYPSFCTRVGWPVQNPIHPDFGLKFNLRSPLGHLPSRRWVGGYNWWRHAGVLAAKLKQCGIT